MFDPVLSECGFLTIGAGGINRRARLDLIRRLCEALCMRTWGVLFCFMPVSYGSDPGDGSFAYGQEIRWL